MYPKNSVSIFEKGHRDAQSEGSLPSDLETEHLGHVHINADTFENDVQASNGIQCTLARALEYCAGQLQTTQLSFCLPYINFESVF